MLNAITLENFKSFKKAELPLGPLTVLIGANASGKSNAIEGIRLLSWLARGERLSNIQSAVQESDRVVRGRAKDLLHRGTSTFSLGCNLDDYIFSIFFRYVDNAFIIDKETLLSQAGVTIYDVFSTGTDFNEFNYLGGKVSGRMSRQTALFSVVRSMPPFQIASSDLWLPCSDLSSGLSRIAFLDAVPGMMRDYCYIANTSLYADARNFSSILHRLCNEETTKVHLLGFVQSLPEQEITDISFLEGPRDDIMLGLVETFGGREEFYDATLLSDGTLRVLAVAAAMLSAEEGSLVVIEEIDNGIHPSRAHQILSQIREIAERRKLRVLLTTHNPALLDALPDAAVPDVVFCYRDPEDGSSKLVRLSDLPDYPSLILQGSLGHLLTAGLIDRFVKTHPGPDARKRQALQWIDDLRQARGGEA